MLTPSHLVGTAAAAPVALRRGQRGRVMFSVPATRALPQASDLRVQAHSHCMAKGQPVMVSFRIYRRLLTGLSFLNVSESYSVCF